MKQLTPEEAMSGIFNEKAQFQRWLDIELSLAKAQAALGIIPKGVPEELKRKGKVELLDLKKQAEITRQIFHPLVAMFRVLQPIMKGDTGEYIHMGATTQDILDTGMMLALQQANGVAYESLRRIEADLLDMAERYTDTIMTGRTHFVHALPITFGYKVAVWAREIRRDIQRLKESRERIFVVQLSGAVGTMAGFGPKGPEIQARVAKDLGLMVPDICWMASRDRTAEFASIMAIAAGTLGRIANNVALLMSTEVGEVFEPFEGIIGSSTMPQKVNPVICEQMTGLARKVRYDATAATEAMIVDYERDLQFSSAGEMDALVDACLSMGKLLTMGETLVKGITINPKKMEANLYVQKGLLLSEAVMLELGKKIGKQSAHEVIYEDSGKAFRTDAEFKDVLLADRRVNKYLSEKDIDRVLNPAAYLGLASKMTGDMVALSRKERKAEEAARRPAKRAR